MSVRTLMLILWPSFLLAGIGSAIIFAFIDPLDVVVFGHIQLERERLYAVGFFALWLMSALSSLLTYKMLPNKAIQTDSDIEF